MATIRKLTRCLLQLYCLTGPLIAALFLATIGMMAGSVSYSAIQAQSVATDSGLTVEEVVRLSHAGFSEELIVTKIKKNGKAFDLNTDELMELKKQGISEAIIRVLLDPTQPYVPTPPAGPTPAAKKYPDDPLANLVPADTGLYVFSGKTPNKADLKVLLGMRKGKMLKGKPTAYLAGATGKMRVKEGKTLFYLRLPDGKEISDVILVSATEKEKEDRRELEGVPGAKGATNAEDVLPFDQLEVGAKLFRISPPALEVGEYVFFLVGSAEPEKGTYGKGYDFGVDSGATEKKK